MKITLETKNPKLFALLEQLAHQLGVKVSYVSSDKSGTAKTSSQKNKNKALVELMEEMVAAGGITSIKDPVKWQKDIRKEKQLHGRT